MIDWTLEVILIKDLKPNSRNPRQMTKVHADKLGELIKKFGLIDKPIINLDRTIIGGHQRINLLKKMKKKEVLCWVPDHQLTQEEVDELCIGLNLNQGDWDYDILANEYEPIDLLNYGFTEEQLIGAAIEATAAASELNDVEEKKKSLKKCPSCGQEF